MGWGLRECSRGYLFSCLFHHKERRKYAEVWLFFWSVCAIVHRSVGYSSACFHFCPGFFLLLGFFLSRSILRPFVARQVEFLYGGGFLLS